MAEVHMVLLPGYSRAHYAISMLVSVGVQK